MNGAKNFFFQMRRQSPLVFELKREPAAVEFVFPFVRQTRQNSGIGRLETVTLLSLQNGERSCVQTRKMPLCEARERLDAFPKTIKAAQRVEAMLKSEYAFAVEQGVVVWKIGFRLRPTASPSEFSTT